MHRDVSTPLDMTRILLENRRTLWIISALIVVLFLTTNLPWQLDDYDQAKQAFTSFEMVKEGHWFYQQTPHEHVATKPPLVGWISAGFFAVTRSWDVAWRLPSFLAAMAILILLFRFATLAYGSIAGLIALSAFGLNLLSPRLATLVRTDMPLALMIFVIGLLIWQKIRKHEPWTERDQLWMFALLTAAMLIKGPIVYAFLLPGIAAFEWWRRKNQASSAWCGRWPWLASLGIFLLWVVGGIVFQHGFFDQVIMREFVARFGETIHRPQPFYFYLPHLLHKFLPWSVLMIALAAPKVFASPDHFGVTDLGSTKTDNREKISPETFWLICWSLGGLLAMSLIPSKRVDRIFPIIAPFCLLIAGQVARAWRNEETRGRTCLWSAVALAFSILFTSGYTISKVVGGYRDHRDALVIFGRNVRQEAERHHWRYETVWAPDEGLLLYLRRPHFFKPDRAVTEWNQGNIDALVVPAQDAPNLMRQLHDAALSQLKPTERKDERGLGYVLITR
jgi:4-amino-4-deoxy-L-arabinose transferase-like glycosyltransferase